LTRSLSSSFLAQSNDDSGASQERPFAALPENVRDLAEKCRAGTVALAPEQSLQVVTACVALGEERAAVADGASTVVVLGNTGKYFICAALFYFVFPAPI